MANQLRCDRGTPLMVWFVAWDSGFDMDMGDGRVAVGSDWMCTLYEMPDKKILVEYRFRYYSPDEGGPFSGKDLKNWNAFVSEGHGPKAVASLMETCRELFDRCRSRPGTTVHDEVPVKEGDILGALRGKPWVHFKTIHPTEEQLSN